MKIDNWTFFMKCRFSCVYGNEGKSVLKLSEGFKFPEVGGIGNWTILS